MQMHTRSNQRGAAALAVAMVLLFGMTLVAFFANRTMIFEQRTSANQVRYTKGFEMADAGVEWAIARLNDPLTLAASPSCATASGTGLLSFRAKYIRPVAADATHATGWFNIVSNVYPGCQIDPSSGSLSCDCPTAANTAATLASTTMPRFRVQFVPVTTANNPTADIQAVEIVSRGCTSGDPCDPSQAATSSDSSSIVRVIVKVRPTFPNVPGAGMISGSTSVVGGSINVINTDTASNGITINTGSSADLTGNGFTVQSLPGTAPASSILDNDPSLLNLTNADATGELFFASFFGEGFSDYQTNLSTKVLSSGAGGSTAAYAAGTCSSASDCAKAVSYWVDQGVTQFWVDSTGVDFGANSMPSTTGGTLGTVNNPIALATAGVLSFGANITAYGIYYAASATANTVDPLGNGNVNIIGSFVARGAIQKQGAGNLSVIYNGSLFGYKGPPKGIVVPVPGSWRDKATPY
jgi:Tfp pilus assembly protein PilX